MIEGFGTIFKLSKMQLALNVFTILWLIVLSGKSLAEQPIRFVSDVWPPYQYLDAKGQAKGICVELLSQVFKRLGKPVEIDFLPWQRAQKKFAKGFYAGQLCVGKSEQRLQLGVFPDEPLVTTKWFAYKNRTNQATPDVSQLTDFDGYSLGYIKGSTYNSDVWQYIATHQPNQVLDDDAQGVKMLNYARFDYMLGEDHNMAYLMDANIKGQVNIARASELPMFDVPLFALFSDQHKLNNKRQAASLASDFAKQLALFKATPEYQQILLKYR